MPRSDIYSLIYHLVLTSVPRPLKKDSICARSLSEISAIEFVSKLKLSRRRSKLSTINECALFESNCHSCPEASYVSEPSEISLDGVLLSLSEFNRCRGMWCAIWKENEKETIPKLKKAWIN